MNRRTKRLLVSVVAIILVLVMSFLTFAEGDLGEFFVNDESVTEEPATAADEEAIAEVSEALDDAETTDEETSEVEEWVAEDISVSYRLFSEEAGWSELVSDGSAAETGEASAFEIVLTETEGLEVLFSAYVLGNGWTSWKSGDDSAQLNNNVSAIRMTLSGDKSDYYDIYYSVKLSDGLWTDWACNAGEAGSMSDCVITGIKVDVVLAGSEFDTKVINGVSEETGPEETETETMVDADEIAETEAAVDEAALETETESVEVETEAAVEVPAEEIETTEAETEAESVVDIIEETEAVSEAVIVEPETTASTEVEAEPETEAETESETEAVAEETEAVAAETGEAAEVTVTEAVEIETEPETKAAEVTVTEAAESAAEIETSSSQDVETQVQIVPEDDYEDEDEEEYTGGFHITTKEDDEDIILANIEGASSNYTDLTNNGYGKVSAWDGVENTHFNTGNGKFDLLSVANTQVGYYRKEGTKTKYGVWYTYPDSKWCAMFVSWCCNQANIAPYTVKPYCRCSSEAAWFKDQKRWKNPAGYTPQPGDIIFFHFDSSTINHTGIVTEVKGSYVYCIEGNNNNSVNRTRHKMTAAYIAGYGTPDYAASDAKLKYSVHVKTYGWLDQVINGKKAGTTGEARRMEAIKISVNDQMQIALDGNIKYSVHVKGKGWMPWVMNGKQAGTTGEYRRMEAIKIKLTEDLARYYNVYYRVHVEHYGWLGWAKNGAIAGSVGKGLRIEAIEIQLVPKEVRAPGKENGAYIQ